MRAPEKRTPGGDRANAAHNQRDSGIVAEATSSCLVQEVPHAIQP